MRRLWLWLARYPELRRWLLLVSDPLTSRAVAQALMSPPKRRTVQGTGLPNSRLRRIGSRGDGSHT